ncbi:MAG TPA: hypothetical protein VGB62_07895 [Allosphingosinicella sp.]|jgi:cytochrome P450
MNAPAAGMDVAACTAILHDPQFDVVELDGYFEALERRSGLALPCVRALIARLLFVTHGERHVVLRRAALEYFRASTIAAWQPEIARRADAIAAGLEERDSADLVPDFAGALSGDVMCRMLGLPPERHADFDRWTGDGLSLIEPLLPLRRLREVEGSLAQFAEVVAGALDAPAEAGGDSLPTLLHHALGGLQGEDRLWLAVALYGASSVTRHTFANILLRVADMPPERRAVLTDKQARMIPVERLIAAESSFDTVARYPRGGESEGQARIDVPIAGASAAALGGGCPVGDAHRGAVRHLAFGSGIHRCIGASLARVVIAEGLSALLRRFPDLSLAAAPSGFLRSATIVSPVDLHCHLRRQKVFS